ncbi:hypothetical protein DFH09DRAFT_1087282 [Mycena vulgaris]|nr:hypothetical protein DFH09DRAFT_1087282 [Mycena vulgaris]
MAQTASSRNYGNYGVQVTEATLIRCAVWGLRVGTGSASRRVLWSVFCTRQHGDDGCWIPDLCVCMGWIRSYACGISRGGEGVAGDRVNAGARVQTRDIDLPDGWVLMLSAGNIGRFVSGWVGQSKLFGRGLESDRIASGEHVPEVAVSRQKVQLLPDQSQAENEAQEDCSIGGPQSDPGCPSKLHWKMVSWSSGIFVAAAFDGTHAMKPTAAIFRTMDRVINNCTQIGSASVMAVEGWIDLEDVQRAVKRREEEGEKADAEGGDRGAREGSAGSSTRTSDLKFSVALCKA